MYRDRERRERRFDGPPREMHKATCADCGEECEVPFKPSGDKPIYFMEKPKAFPEILGKCFQHFP